MIKLPTLPVAAIGDRGCVPAMGYRGHLIPPAHRHKPTHAPSLRGYHIGFCFALLVVLQLKANNILPLKATLTGPGAVLVKSTNGFILNITGGERPYVVEWWRGYQPLGSNTVSGAGMVYAYVAPDDPKEEMLTAFVSDARSDPCPRETSANCSFWQVQITLKKDGMVLNSEPVVWIGERIRLSSVIAPHGVPYISKEWGFENALSVVKNYDVGPISNVYSRCVLERLTAADLQTECLEFYWIQGDIVPTSQVFQFYLVHDARTKLSVTASMKVRKPIYDYDPIIRSESLIACDRSYFSTNDTDRGYSCHYGRQNCGEQHYAIYHNGPFSEDGVFMLAQIVDQQCLVRRENWRDEYIDRIGYDGIGLHHTRFWYDAPAYSYPVWPFVYPPWFYIDITQNSQFHTYVMFKPFRADSIWVPIRLHKWRWKCRYHVDTLGTWQCNWKFAPHTVNDPFTVLPTWERKVLSKGLK